MRALLFAFLLLLFTVSASDNAYAQCTNPAGAESKVVYNADGKVLQYCDGTGWIRMNQVPGSGSGGCTNPTKPEGAGVYNADGRVLQICAGNVWRAMGPVISGESCTSETTPETPIVANGGTASIVDGTKLNRPRQIFVSGDYAYVACQSGDSLTVVDISDPLNPVIANGGNAWVTDATKLDGAHGIDVAENYAYVTSIVGNSLTVVDISDPLNPVIANGGNAWVTDATKLVFPTAVKIQGSYAYVTSQNSDSLTVIDISDPLNPVIANSGNAWVADATKLNGSGNLQVSGNYAYVVSSALGADSLTVVDISDPLNPVIANGGNAWIQDATKLTSPVALDIKGAYAYVLASGADALTVIDISDPLNPVIANGGNAWIQDATKLNAPRAVSVVGNHAYVTSNSGTSFTTIDISDPLNPVIADGGNAWVQDATNLGSPRNLDVSGNFAYVANANENRFTIVDTGDCNGGGGSSCTNPARTEGTLLYNSSSKVMQYCDGASWVAIGKEPLPDCPNIGDLCFNGSYYVGDIGAGKVYATAAASESNQSWNNGTFNPPWTVTGFTSNTDGPGNTAGLVALGDAGSPYDAAVYCDGLTNVHGHSDWYLPARDELNLFWNGGSPVAGVLEDGTLYWSSTESNNIDAWIQRFDDGFQGNGGTKSFPRAIRCVRR